MNELSRLSQRDLRKCVCWKNFRPIFQQRIDIAQLFFREICTQARGTNQIHVIYFPPLSLKKQEFLHELLAAYRIPLRRNTMSRRSSRAVFRTTTPLPSDRVLTSTKDRAVDWIHNSISYEVLCSTWLTVRTVSSKSALDGIILHKVVLDGFALHECVFDGIALHAFVLDGGVLHGVVLDGFALHGVVSDGLAFNDFSITRKKSSELDITQT